MLKGAGQQVVAGLFEKLPVQILGADGYDLGASHILAEVGDAEAAFALGVAAFLVNNLRVDEDELSLIHI